MMDLGSVVNQGLIGMQKSQLSMANSAQQIAQAGTKAEVPTSQSAGQMQLSSAPDLSKSLINLRVQTQIFDASAQVVKSADETIGTLLDTRA